MMRSNKPESQEALMNNKQYPGKGWARRNQVK
jgi:hypothetical protein